MTYELLETVVLDCDVPVPEHGLRAGDLGAVVHVYEPDGIEVEFVTVAGRTQALLTLREKDIRHVEAADLVAVRRLTKSA
jgi:hypothetical protein